MFKITCTTSGVEYLLYAPNTPDYRVTSPMLNMELNKSGLLTFGVPDAHPNRAQILPLTSDITVYEDGVAIWYGRSITNEKDFYKTGKITCEGELAFLYDSIYRPFAFTGTITDFLTALIANHNAQVETRKEFTLGTVSVVDSNGNIARSSETALKTLDVVQTRLLDTNGGYLRVRHSGGVRYLDYLATYGTTATQKIEFAKNLIDLTQFIDATKVRTVLIPYGAEIPGAADGERLTIESVNSGLDYISNSGAVAVYGQIWETIIFDDVTIAANLLAKATAYLSELIAQAVTLKLSMVDLAVLGTETRINIGDTVQAKSVPHGLDSSFLATSVNIDILHPELTRMSFGSTKKAFTTQNNQTKLDVSKSVDAVSARILLASQLITGAVGGYVVLDPPEKPERILIMDTADMATATNVWQFNVNGLGFSSTGIDGPYKTAMTMDGKIVTSATINGKEVNVTISPQTPFELEIDGTKEIYVTSEGVLVTSRYDVNEDGFVDQEDFELVANYILTGTGYLPRMDVNGDGSVNALDLNAIIRGGSMAAFNLDDTSRVSGMSDWAFWLVRSDSVKHYIHHHNGFAWARYNFVDDGGDIGTITPSSAYNTTIPAKSIIVGVMVNVIAAITSGGSATMAIGLAGTGGSSTSLLGATGKASLTTGALLNGARTFASPLKITGAGGITFTIGGAAVTAGSIEVFVEYFMAEN